MLSPIMIHTVRQPAPHNANRPSLKRPELLMDVLVISLALVVGATFWILQR